MNGGYAKPQPVATEAAHAPSRGDSASTYAPVLNRRLRLAPVRRKFFPGEELTAAGAGVGFAIGDDDFAVRDGFARPSGYFEPLKWIIVGARMHLRAADHDFAAGVEYHQVGIGPNHDRPLARVEPET